MFKTFNNVIIKLHHSKLQISLRVRVSSARAYHSCPLSLSLILTFKIETIVLCDACVGCDIRIILSDISQLYITVLMDTRAFQYRYTEPACNPFVLSETSIS